MRTIIIKPRPKKENRTSDKLNKVEKPLKYKRKEEIKRRLKEAKK